METLSSRVKRKANSRRNFSQVITRAVAEKILHIGCFRLSLQGERTGARDSLKLRSQVFSSRRYASAFTTASPTTVYFKSFGSITLASNGPYAIHHGSTERSIVYDPPGYLPWLLFEFGSIVDNYNI
ncbi:hypothetical protein OPT61_g9456 [Boeremia exigua]|uniref:Uncharacterized protein n=1 Tax=Boeremia exigua TaxID=749465 RepID=A0ACC2HU09_9PLEO|nr:hypothetical protein OPT61_g9456 [Boeremia exigua]